MQNKALIVCVVLTILFLSVSKANAIYDPRNVPNNPAGIHILFTEELENAAKLVNAGGGDWGYVTIPIQANDRNLDKWQKFMDDAKRLHLVPIIRLATEPYRGDTTVWRKPDFIDVLDSANFLNSLHWPTKNRYVILFNEVNRYDEWQGEPPSPEVYADIVTYAHQVFKRRSDEFFLILGGLDNASPNDRVRYMDNIVYLREMGQYDPEIFSKIDGFSSHSYPNPGFSQPPSTNLVEGTATYKFENQVISSYLGEEIPVFVTETGWDAEVVGEELSASYLATAFDILWSNDRNVVAVTPFLLESNYGPFTKFTFLRNGEVTKTGEALRNLPKRLGRPEVKGIATVVNPILEQKTAQFAYASQHVYHYNETPRVLKSFFKALLGVN